MNQIEINIDEKPRAFQSHGIGETDTGETYLYNTKGKNQYQLDIKHKIIKHLGRNWRKLHGTIEVSVLTFFFETKHKKLHGKLHAMEPDIDNLQKTFFDVLKNCFMGDDRNIARLRLAEKRWSKHPGIHCILKEIEK